MAWHDGTAVVCGWCIRHLEAHRVTRHPHFWAAYCPPAFDLQSDITDQQLLRAVAEGNPYGT